ncbi:MAG: exo-alpha-sialidase [Acidobacteria bacterium]|nr:exo-alpha-sialidase [Acidobacteriota bacterium]
MNRRTLLVSLPAALTAQQPPPPERLLATGALLASPMQLKPAPGRTSTVYRAAEGQWQFNLHSYMAFHEGRFWAMWSSGRVDEDSSNQFIQYATSRDGHTWSEARSLAPDPDGEDKPQRWIARGIYVRDGKLTALGALIESAAYGQRGKGEVWSNLQLMHFIWNGKKWETAGVFAPDCMNNYPPVKLGGRSAMPCRDSRMDMHFLLSAAPGQWSKVRIPSEPPNHRMDEPTWYEAADGSVHMIIRDGTRSGYLLRSLSRDKGQTWSSPVRTNYPDATSKNCTGRLSTGAYYLINNPHPKQRDPLAISFSPDGWVFDHPLSLRTGAPPRRYGGKAKGSGSIQYPHAIEHNGSLWVIYSTNKEDIEIGEYPIAGLPTVK